MNILYFDHESITAEAIHKVAKHLMKKLGPDTLVLPKSFDLLLDCSEEQLLKARDLIDKALEKQKESC